MVDQIRARFSTSVSGEPPTAEQRGASNVIREQVIHLGHQIDKRGAN